MCICLLSYAVYSQDSIPPSVPTNFIGIGDGGVVRLYWDKNTESDLNKYVIYRGTIQYGQLNYLTQVNSADTSYFDYDVSLGTTYYYAISAVDSSGNESQRTPQMSIGITPIPTMPSNFRGIGDGGVVRLYWDKNTESYLKNYVIYRGTIQYGQLNFLAHANSADTSYFDYDVSLGTIYYYVISAVDSSGNESQRTPQMSIGITPIPNRSICWISINDNNELIVTIDSIVHQDYGFALPVTYEIGYPNGSIPESISYRYSMHENYTNFEIKTDTSFFNNIYAARINNINNVVYVSVGFSSKTDSIYILMSDRYGNSLTPIYNRVSPLYDSRKAVVTASADDWHQWGDEFFNQTINNFRQYKIPLTVGLITEGTNYSVAPMMTADIWQSIQNQLDLGFVEVASHSRNHLQDLEYPDIKYEVNGSKEDIVNNLSLPANYTYGDREYVYIWIAPGGGYSAATERMVAQSKYLGTRGYILGKNYITKWNPNINLFDIFGFTVEIGDVPWGGETNPAYLSNQFDTVINEGGVYHIMCHPSQIAEDWDSKPYLRNHLSYISERKDIWYTTLGHLYLYQRLFSASQYVFNTINDIVIPQEFNIAQNYPNPFNPKTTIQYTISIDSEVNIVIYDLMGKEVMTLVKEYKQVGQYTTNWNGKDNSGQSVSGGVYFYKLQAGDFIQTRKMVLLK
jgi:hypothetical protein